MIPTFKLPQNTKEFSCLVLAIWVEYVLIFFMVMPEVYLPTATSFFQNVFLAPAMIAMLFSLIIYGMFGLFIRKLHASIWQLIVLSIFHLVMIFEAFITLDLVQSPYQPPYTSLAGIHYTFDTFWLCQALNPLSLYTLFALWIVYKQKILPIFVKRQ